MIERVDTADRFSSSKQNLKLYESCIDELVIYAKRLNIITGLMY